MLPKGFDEEIRELVVAAVEVVFAILFFDFVFFLMFVFREKPKTLEDETLQKRKLYD